MLLRFTLENWMSFRDQATLSMVASKERQHGHRVPRVAKYGMRVLPIASIYGGNASGKTNLFKALRFAKTQILKGSQPESLIPVDPFKLAPASADQPCRFSFELLIDATIYEYSFAVTRKLVVEEKLVEISTASERVLYHRRDGSPHFDDSLRKDTFLNYAFQGTRDNQLFLTNTVSQKIERFKPVYDWFRDTLELVAPDSRFELFEQFLQEGHPLYPLLNSSLAQLDTGIQHLGAEMVAFDTLPWPEALRTKLQEEIKEGETARIMSDSPNERYIVTRSGGELLAQKLITYHQRSDGEDVKFEMRQESDGSQRIIDLLPVFLELGREASHKVYLIDELDRSLHTLLTRQLLECYLASCSPESRSQLLFTTHDVLLMDQELLRRDEMWVTERERSGCSTLRSFSEYKDVRYDKDIQKSYLQGRLGGVPRILLGDGISCGTSTAKCAEG